MSLNIFLSDIFRLVVKKASRFFGPCNASHIDFHHGLDLLPFLGRAGAHHLLLHDHLDLLVLFFLSFDDIVGWHSGGWGVLELLELTEGLDLGIDTVDLHFFLGLFLEFIFLLLAQKLGFEAWVSVFEWLYLQLFILYLPWLFDRWNRLKVPDSYIWTLIIADPWKPSYFGSSVWTFPPSLLIVNTRSSFRSLSV